MAAPVLSTSEQKSALSAKGKKKKKKVIKNVLGLPSNLTVQVETIGLEESEKLSKILERLLPIARLPIQPNFKFKKELPNTEKSINETDLQVAKSKRSQLSVGVNEVNKGLKKKIISAVLLANDIQPKFLVQHLNLLCNHNNTPFVSLPKFRDLTKKTLGFPCIALGFKSNYSDFLEVVNEIKRIFEYQKSKNKEEIKSENSDSEDDEISDIEDLKLGVEEEPIEFTYLYRNSKTERVFIPEGDKRPTKKSDVEFISISKDDDVEEVETSLTFKFTDKKKMKKGKMLSLKDLDMDVNNEEFDIPSKKIKKDWVIDTVGDKQNFRYFPTNLIRTQSNPHRVKKKNKKL